MQPGCMRTFSLRAGAGTSPLREQAFGIWSGRCCGLHGPPSGKRWIAATGRCVAGGSCAASPCPRESADDGRTGSVLPEKPVFRQALIRCRVCRTGDMIVRKVVRRPQQSRPGLLPGLRVRDRVSHSVGVLHWSRSTGVERLRNRPVEPEPDHAGVGNGTMSRPCCPSRDPLPRPDPRDVAWPATPSH